MRTACLLISCTLWFAGCTSAGDAISKGPRGSASNHSKNETNTNTLGLTRVGELPDTESADLTIRCANEQICWLNTRKFLWQSVDGGKNWREMSRAPGDEEIISYHFIDTEIGFSFSFGKLYRTEDGGRTWAYQESPIESPHGEIRSLSFLEDGKTGWLAGGIYRDQTSFELKYGVANNVKDETGKRVLEPAIFRTSDGAKTWQRQRFLNGAGWGRILLIQFVNEQQGIALGSRQAYHTKNGGLTWQPIEFNESCVRREYLDDEYDVRPDNLAMQDSKLIWISYSDGRVIKSIDGGQHWCDLIHPGEIGFDAGREFLTAMHFDNAEHGWGLGADRLLYETKDAGKTWSRVNSDIRFNSIDFVEPGHAFLVSDRSIYNLTR